LNQENPRIHVVGCPVDASEVDAWNHGLCRRVGDVALLGSDVQVSEGWLDELAEVAHSEERTFCAAPLLNEIVCSSVPDDRLMHPQVLGNTDIRAAIAGLPRWTVVPVLTCDCCYVRGDLLEAVGLMDTAYPMASAAVMDWVMKAQALGFFVKRANHVLVQRMKPGREDTEKEKLIESGCALLTIRHPQLQPQIDQYSSTLDRALTDHAIALQATGQLRVAFDLRSLPPQQVGTRTYAVCLGKALSELPEIDLTLLVHEPEQAEGLTGRLMTPETWRNDVQIIHRPMQMGRGDLAFLYESSAHLIITYQDLIGYRIPQVFLTDDDFQSYQEASRLSLQGTQRILVYSESTAREIAEEFHIPRHEIDVVPLGVDVGWFSHTNGADARILEQLKLPERFFLSVATDFPHKNLQCLLKAYGSFRATWREGNCPELLLAGNKTTSRGGVYRQNEWVSQVEGVRFLGAVTADQLRTLYQRSEALIFPSLYEGFGLPPLEAMAAGTAVIAMPISSVPEVGGQSVLYPEGLSPESLASAMARLAGDPHLRARLCEAGAQRVGHFSWACTARKTAEVYRSAVLKPSARSIAMRRQLRETILSWSRPGVPSTITIENHTVLPQTQAETLGIRTAWRELHSAVHRRLRREVKRLIPVSPRGSA
jgi:glycosyltransferase involved in cell wall biosynthesis